MVEERSGQPSEAEKEGGTEKTEQQTILDGFPYRLADCSLISGGVRFRNDGKEEDGNGVGNGGGKQDQRAIPVSTPYTLNALALSYP